MPEVGCTYYYTNDTHSHTSTCSHVGIYYAKVHHMLLTTWKSSTRATTIEDMCTQVPQLMQFANSVMQDGSVAMRPDSSLFPDDFVAQSEVSVCIVWL